MKFQVTPTRDPAMHLTAQDVAACTEYGDYHVAFDINSNIQGRVEVAPLSALE